MYTGYKRIFKIYCSTTLTLCFLISYSAATLLIGRLAFASRKQLREMPGGVKSIVSSSLLPQYTQSLFLVLVHLKSDKILFALRPVEPRGGCYLFLDILSNLLKSFIAPCRRGGGDRRKGKERKNGRKEREWKK